MCDLQPGELPPEFDGVVNVAGYQAALCAVLAQQDGDASDCGTDTSDGIAYALDRQLHPRRVFRDFGSRLDDQVGKRTLARRQQARAEKAAEKEAQKQAKAAKEKRQMAKKKAQPAKKAKTTPPAAAVAAATGATAESPELEAATAVTSKKRVHQEIGSSSSSDEQEEQEQEARSIDAPAAKTPLSERRQNGKDTESSTAVKGDDAVMHEIGDSEEDDREQEFKVTLSQHTVERGATLKHGSQLFTKSFTVERAMFEAQSNKVAAKLLKKLRAKHGNKCAEDDTRLFVFAPGRKSNPAITDLQAGDIDLLHAFDEKHKAGTVMLSVAVVGSKKVGKKKKEAQQTALNLNDEDGDDDDDNSDDDSEGLAGGGRLQKAKDMRASLFDDGKADSKIKQLLEEDGITHGADEVMAVRKYLKAHKGHNGSSYDEFMSEDVTDLKKYIPHFEDATFLAFCRGGCGEGVQHAKPPPCRIGACAATAKMDPLDRLIVEKLGGSSTSEQQKEAEVKKTTAAAAKLKAEAVSSIMSTLPDGASKNQLAAKAAAFAMSLLDG